MALPNTISYHPTPIKAVICSFREGLDYKDKLLQPALTMPLQLWFGLPKSHLYLSGVRHSQWSLSFPCLGKVPNLLFYLGLPSLLLFFLPSLTFFTPSFFPPFLPSLLLPSTSLWMHAGSKRLALGSWSVGISVDRCVDSPDLHHCGGSLGRSQCHPGLKQRTTHEYSGGRLNHCMWSIPSVCQFTNFLTLFFGM